METKLVACGVPAALAALKAAGFPAPVLSLLSIGHNAAAVG